MEKKKLALKKETLRHLETAAVRLAAAGPIQPFSFKHTCAGCESQEPACTLPPTACLATCSC
jgi:hypothetical protein